MIANYYDNTDKYGNNTHVIQYWTSRGIMPGHRSNSRYCYLNICTRRILQLEPSAFCAMFQVMHFIPSAINNSLLYDIIIYDIIYDIIIIIWYI